MSALTADRNTPRRDGIEFSYPMAASKEIFAGALVFLDTAGNAEPATTATGKICAGAAQEYKLSTTIALTAIKVRTGCFRFANGETITKAHIGDLAYALDDQTLYRTASGKSPVGVIVDVDTDGVWVKIDPPQVQGSTGLLVANNLSDVGTVATARSNLGLDTGDSPTFTGLTLTGAETVGTTLDVTGRITGLRKHIAGGVAYTVSSAVDGLGWITTATDNAVITLPDAAAGNDGKEVTITCTAANGAAKVSVSPHSSDGIFGGVNGAAGGTLVTFSGTVDKDAILTKATALKGDYISLISDGSTGWYVIGGQGVWASEA